jgi:hypothetical protein
LTLRAFEQGGIFIAPYMLWQQFSRSDPKDRPIQSPFTAHKGMLRIYSNPDPHGSAFFNRDTIWVKDSQKKHKTIFNQSFQMHGNLGYYEYDLVNEGLVLRQTLHVIPPCSNAVKQRPLHRQWWRLHINNIW